MRQRQEAARAEREARQQEQEEAAEVGVRLHIGAGADVPDRAQALQHVGSHRVHHLDRVTTTLRQHHSTHPRVRALLTDLPHAV